MTPGADADADLIRSVVEGVPAGVSRVAVAVSGGGDSLALLHLLSLAGLSVQAVTVDHGLRPESAAEAASVGDICRRLGVPHRVLSWQHGAICGNLMEQARLARRRLLSEWARAEGVQAIALGHTADDQAEGFLMALARASGLDGLSGMAPQRFDRGLWWLRPLLGHGRAELRDHLRRHGLRWIDDPTNADPRFLRTRAREALAALAGVGVSAPAIARSARQLAEARNALAQTLAGFVSDHVVEQAGALELPRAAFSALPPDLQRRLIAAAVRWIGGAAHPPRGAAQLQVQAALASGRGATLGGVRFRAGPRTLRIAREPRAVGPAVPVGSVWDGRWHVWGPAGEVRALGADGLAQIVGWQGCSVPRDALIVSPGVWRESRLIAAPAADFGREHGARVACPFASFLLSH